MGGSGGLVLGLEGGQGVPGSGKLLVETRYDAGSGVMLVQGVAGGGVRIEQVEKQVQLLKTCSFHSLVKVYVSFIPIFLHI